MIYDVIVVGGGASGMAAAIMASREGAKHVLLLEKQPRVGKKLLATGNGRCNITNVGARATDYAGASAFAGHALYEFSPERTLAFFESVGLMCREARDGCVYPLSNQASSVLDCLRLALHELGVGEVCDFCAAKISPKGDMYRVIGADGRAFDAKRVIVSVGGRAAPKLGGCADFEKLLAPLGHAFARCLPALSPMATDTAPVAGLKGVRHQGAATLLINGREVAREAGEILFTDYGASGIAVMQLSSMAARALADGAHVALALNFLGLREDEARAFLRARLKVLPARPMSDFLLGVVNKLVCLRLLRACDLPGTLLPGALSPEAIARLAHALCAYTLRVRAVKDYESAQVMQGGACADGFNPETMESRHAKGLYATGELMDVTGPCGGYNLQWAWASGLLAGRSAAKSL